MKKNITTCSKIFPEIPFAHRQAKHDGHCAFIHGHDWSIRLTFGAEFMEENGFVVDFGKMGPIKNWISEHLDHALVLAMDDPVGRELGGVLGVSIPKCWLKIFLVPDCSCEGLAQFLYERLNPIVQEMTGGRAFLTQVELFEGSRNSATFTPPLR